MKSNTKPFSETTISLTLNSGIEAELQKRNFNINFLPQISAILANYPSSIDFNYDLNNNPALLIEILNTIEARQQIEVAYLIKKHDDNFIGLLNQNFPNGLQSPISIQELLALEQLLNTVNTYLFTTQMQLQENSVDKKFENLSRLPIDALIQNQALLSQVTALDLSNNILTSLPNELPLACPNLASLNLAQNAFVVIPDCINALTLLKNLDISDNQNLMLDNSKLHFGENLSEEHSVNKSLCCKNIFPISQKIHTVMMDFIEYLNRTTENMGYDTWPHELRTLIIGLLTSGVDLDPENMSEQDLEEINELTECLKKELPTMLAISRPLKNKTFMPLYDNGMRDVRMDGAQENHKLPDVLDNLSINFRV